MNAGDSALTVCVPVASVEDVGDKGGGMTGGGQGVVGFSASENEGEGRDGVNVRFEHAPRPFAEQELDVVGIQMMR